MLFSSYLIVLFISRRSLSALDRIGRCCEVLQGCFPIVGNTPQSSIFVLQSHRVHFSVSLLCLFVQLWVAKGGFGVSTY